MALRFATNGARHGLLPRHLTFYHSPRSFKDIKSVCVRAQDLNDLERLEDFFSTGPSFLTSREVRSHEDDYDTRSSIDQESVNQDESPVVENSTISGDVEEESVGQSVIVPEVQASAHVEAKKRVINHLSEVKAFKDSAVRHVNATFRLGAGKKAQVHREAEENSSAVSWTVTAQSGINQVNARLMALKQSMSPASLNAVVGALVVGCALAIIRAFRAQEAARLAREEAARQESTRRARRGEKQRQRFQQMLGSDDGVDASVFTAVQQIGEIREGDAEEDTLEPEMMTPEIKAAWKQFVKQSKLSEGEFWSPDDIDLGLEEIEIEFDESE